MIRIKSKLDGFRRCGVIHKKGITEYEDSVFDSSQIKEFKADPNFEIEITHNSRPSKKDKAE